MRITSVKVTTLFLYLVVVGCAQPIPSTPTPQPQMAYFWTGDPARSPSDQQFAKDKYACAQDYRMTQPAVPVQRDVATEIRLMTMHLSVCLESKGWELRPINEQPKTNSISNQEPWNKYAVPKKPKTMDTSQVGDAEMWEALDKHLPKILIWEGDPTQEPSLQQFKIYLRACDGNFKALHPKYNMNNDGKAWVEYLNACMKAYGYGNVASATK